MVMQQQGAALEVNICGIYGDVKRGNALEVCMYGDVRRGAALIAPRQ
jgi:hypothetical protein